MGLERLLGKADMGTLVAAAMKHIDMEAMIADVMGGLQLKDLRLFFVVRTEFDFEFVGMAYSEASARELKSDHEGRRGTGASIWELDIERLLQLAKEVGATREVYIET